MRDESVTAEAGRVRAHTPEPVLEQLDCSAAWACAPAKINREKYAFKALHGHFDALGERLE